MPTFESCCRLPSQMNCVFSEFNFRRFEDIHEIHIPWKYKQVYCVTHVHRSLNTRLSRKMVHQSSFSERLTVIHPHRLAVALG